MGCEKLETMSRSAVNYVPFNICTFGNEAALHYFLHYAALIVEQAINVLLPTVPLINS